MTGDARAGRPAGTAALDVVARPESVPQARHWVRDLLASWSREDVLEDAELLVAELLGNVVLHAPGPARVAVAEREGSLRLEVADSSTRVPERRSPQEGGTTGRGLNLVEALAGSWGVEPREDGLPGKVVWCRLGPGDARAPGPDVDVDALLAAFGDDEPLEVLHRVSIGEAPVGLAVAAKDHLDGLLREFALAGATHGGPLAHEVVQRIRAAVVGFADGRAQLRRQLTAARGRGEERVVVAFQLPATAAEAAEDYLAALAEADTFARDRRLLTLESPVAFRVLREWYVGAVIAGLRSAAQGLPQPVPESFERRLLVELERLDHRAREVELAARLQRVTARLAAAQTQPEIAEAAVEEGLLALGADGGTASRPGPGMTTVVVERGADVGLSSRYGAGADRPAGPSSLAMRTAAPVWSETREQRDALFPHLAALQPRVVALAALPLVVAGQVVGAVRFSWTTPHVFSSAERTYLAGLAGQTAQALARTDALEALRVAHADALSTSVRLELTLSAVGVGSFDLDLRTRRLSSDDALYALHDVTPATFDGTLASFFSRVEPEDAARVVAAVEHASAAAEDLVVDYRLRRPDGRLRWLEARGRPLPGHDGTPARLVGVCLDVTERRDASTRALRSLELMREGFVQLDGDGTVRYANPEAERMTGLPQARLLGLPLAQALGGELGQLLARGCAQAARTGAPQRFAAHLVALGSDVEVRVHPESDGTAVYLADVGPERAVARERDAALHRLRLLDEIGAAVTATLDVDEALAALAQRLLPDLADLVTVDLRDGEDAQALREVVATSVDPRRAALLRAADDVLPRRRNPGSSVHRVLSGEPYVHLAVTPRYLESVAAGPEQLRLYLEVDMRYGVVVPLAARGRVFGTLTLLRTGPEAVPFTEQDVQFAVETGRRAGLLVDNAAQYTAQRRVAEQLQRSLLPELPSVAGVDLGAAYEPAARHAKVGGDWYDAFVLPGGALGLVVGDVVGHDVAAAATMGQLRSVLRTCAADGSGPAGVLDQMDRLVATFAVADLATVVYAQLARTPDGGGLLSWSSAGHPPPLLLTPGRPAVYLPDGGSTMIGVEVAAPRRPATAVLPPGSTLLLYSDGVVERRGADLDDRLAELRTVAAGLVDGGADPGALCGTLVAQARADGSADDAAALAVRLH